MCSTSTDPAILVGFHVFGAVLVFVAVQELLFSMRAAGVRRIAPVVTHSDTSVGMGPRSRLMGGERTAGRSPVSLMS
jgi:hypothetical protein